MNIEDPKLKAYTNDSQVIDDLDQELKRFTAYTRVKYVREKKDEIKSKIYTKDDWTVFIQKLSKTRLFFSSKYFSVNTKSAPVYFSSGALGILSLNTVSPESLNFPNSFWFIRLGAVKE